MKDKIVKILRDNSSEINVDNGISSVCICGVYPELFEKVAEHIDSLYTVHTIHAMDISNDEIEEFIKNEKMRWTFDLHEVVSKTIKHTLDWALSKARNETPPKDGVNLTTK